MFRVYSATSGDFEASTWADVIARDRLMRVVLREAGSTCHLCGMVNCLSNEDAEASCWSWGEAIKANSVITSLVMRKREWSDEDMFAIADALHWHPSIMQLQLGELLVRVCVDCYLCVTAGPVVGDTGANLLGNMVAMNSTLTSLSVEGCSGMM